MNITKNAVVSIEFVLKDDSGEVIDASEGDPMDYLHGHDQLVPGLERKLEGKSVGAKFEAKVPPADGYGERDPNRVVVLERSEFPDDLIPELGMELNAEGPDGQPVILWVTDISEDGITVDGNHPLAGQTLNFAIEVTGVRQASSEELEHGHVHGPDSDH